MDQIPNQISFCQPRIFNYLDNKVKEKNELNEKCEENVE